MNDFSKIGYEYGVKPYFIILSDMEFANHFQQAKCLGINYVFNYRDMSNPEPVQLGFLFEKETYAEKFMDCLLNWIEKSDKDGDAVSIDFIEKKGGKYALAISPELERLTQRLIPKELQDKVSPIFMVQTQFKEMSVGQNFQLFKNKYSEGKRISIGYFIGNTSKIEKQSEKYFVKTKFNFYHESSIPNDSVAVSYKAVNNIDNFNPKDLPKPPKESIDEIESLRNKELSNYFPITINKLKNLDWLIECQKLLFERYTVDQIHQAICNLVLFERIKKENDLSEDFTEAGYPTRILEYLVSTFESFDSFVPDDLFFTSELIEEQIKTDINELQSYLSK